MRRLALIFMVLCMLLTPVLAEPKADFVELTAPDIAIPGSIVTIFCTVKNVGSSGNLLVRVYDADTNTMYIDWHGYVAGSEIYIAKGSFIMPNRVVKLNVYVGHQKPDGTWVYDDYCLPACKTIKPPPVELIGILLGIGVLLGIVIAAVYFKRW